MFRKLLSISLCLCLLANELPAASFGGPAPDVRRSALDATIENRFNKEALSLLTAYSSERRFRGRFAAALSVTIGMSLLSGLHAQQPRSPEPTSASQSLEEIVPETVRHQDGTRWTWPARLNGDYRLAGTLLRVEPHPRRNAPTGGFRQDLKIWHSYGTYTSLANPMEVDALLKRYEKRFQGSRIQIEVARRVIQDAFVFEAFRQFLSDGGSLVEEEGLGHYSGRPLKIHMSTSDLERAHHIFFHELLHYVLDKMDASLSDSPQARGIDQLLIDALEERFMLIFMTQRAQPPWNYRGNSGLYGFTYDRRVEVQIKNFIDEGEWRELHDYVNTDLRFYQSYVHSGMIVPLGKAQYAREHRGEFPIVTGDLQDIAHLQAYNAQILRGIIAIGSALAARDGQPITDILGTPAYQTLFDKFREQYSDAMERDPKGSLRQTATNILDALLKSENLAVMKTPGPSPMHFDPIRSASPKFVQVLNQATPAPQAAQVRIPSQEQLFGVFGWDKSYEPFITGLTLILEGNLMPGVDAITATVDKEKTPHVAVIDTTSRRWLMVIQLPRPDDYPIALSALKGKVPTTMTFEVTIPKPAKPDRPSKKKSDPLKGHLLGAMAIISGVTSKKKPKLTPLEEQVVNLLEKARAREGTVALTSDKERTLVNVLNKAMKDASLDAVTSVSRIDDTRSGLYTLAVKIAQTPSATPWTEKMIKVLAQHMHQEYSLIPPSPISLKEFDTYLSEWSAAELIAARVAKPDGKLLSAIDLALREKKDKARQDLLKKKGGMLSADPSPEDIQKAVALLNELRQNKTEDSSGIHSDKKAIALRDRMFERIKEAQLTRKETKLFSFAQRLARAVSRVQNLPLPKKVEDLFIKLIITDLSSYYGSAIGKSPDTVHKLMMQVPPQRPIELWPHSQFSHFDTTERAKAIIEFIKKEQPSATVSKILLLALVIGFSAAGWLVGAGVILMAGVAFIPRLRQAGLEVGPNQWLSSMIETAIRRDHLVDRLTLEDLKKKNRFLGTLVSDERDYIREVEERLTDNGQSWAVIFEKAQDRLFKSDNHDAHLTMISVPLVDTNKIEEYYGLADFSDIFKARLQKTLHDKGITAGLLGGRLILLDFDLNEKSTSVYKALRQTRKSVKSDPHFRASIEQKFGVEAKKKLAAWENDIDRLRFFAADQGIYAANIFEEHTESRVHLSNLIEIKIEAAFKELNGRLELLEKNPNDDMRRFIEDLLQSTPAGAVPKGEPPILMFPGSASEDIGSLLLSEDESLRKEYQALQTAGRQKALPIFDYHTGKLPRMAHLDTSWKLGPGSSLQKALHQLQEDVNENNLAVFKIAYAEYRTAFWKSLGRAYRDPRLPEVYKYDWINEIAVADHDGALARAEDHLKDLPALFDEKQTKELQSSSFFFAPSKVYLFKRSVGDEFGVLVNPFGEYWEGFAELNKGNAYFSKVGVDSQDSIYHHILLELIKTTHGYIDGLKPGESPWGFLELWDDAIQRVAPESYLPSEKVPTESGTVRMLAFQFKGRTELDFPMVVRNRQDQFLKRNPENLTDWLKAPEIVLENLEEFVTRLSASRVFHSESVQPGDVKAIFTTLSHLVTFQKNPRLGLIHRVMDSKALERAA